MKHMYALADYIVTLKPSESLARVFGETITIGGDGNIFGPTDSIKVGLKNGSILETTGYATGGWVHSKSYDRTGTVEFNISQISDQVTKLINLCNFYYNGNYDGMTITVTNNNDNTIVATCEDCYVDGIPEQSLGTSAGMQTWTFNCGKVTFRP